MSNQEKKVKKEKKKKRKEGKMKNKKKKKNRKTKKETKKREGRNDKTKDHLRMHTFAWRILESRPSNVWFSWGKVPVLDVIIL